MRQSGSLSKGARLGVVATGLLLATALTAGAVEVLEGPTLTMDPNGLTPLAGVVELVTDVPVETQLTISGGGDLWVVNFPHPTTVHYLPVLGLKPDRSYNVDVELIPGGFAGSLPADTGPLPSEFPVLQTPVRDVPSMEPGFTLIDCISRGQGVSRPRYTMIVDDAGDVVWYTNLCSSESFQLVNGYLFFRDGLDMVEYDMVGNLRLQVPLAAPGGLLHHDGLRTPMGTYLSLDKISVQVDDYPTSDTDPDAPTQTATVEDTPVVEFLPDGAQRAQWDLTEMLDPTRIGYDSLRSGPTGYDWAHANAVIYDASDDSLIASVRHQDAVVKFSRATGDLIWILGPHDNWIAEFQPYLLQSAGSPFRWPYHQHGPMLTSESTLLLFDNGNYRASPFDGNDPLAHAANFSRAVEFEIDEQTMQVSQLWEYGESIPERLFSRTRGDADELPGTGNVLMTFGDVRFVGGAPSSNIGLGISHTRVVEATRDTPPVRVFELVLHDAAGGSIMVQRSERIASLYPQQYVRAPNGVGTTLRASRETGSIRLDWTEPPVDSEHDAAYYYVLYASTSSASGFAVPESSAQTTATLTSTEDREFYRIVAANTAGTSGDEPTP